MKELLSLSTMSLLLLASLSLARAEHTVHGQNPSNQAVMQTDGVMTNNSRHDNMPATSMNIDQANMNHTSMGSGGKSGNAGSNGMGSDSNSSGMGDGAGSGGMGGGSGSGGMGGGSGSGGSGSGSGGGMGRH